MRRSATLVAILVIPGLAAVIGFQQKELRHERGRTAALRQDLADAETLREETARVVTQQTDTAELEQLRKEHSELLKLRGEVAQLRRQAAEAAKRPPATNVAAQVAAAPETNAPPVETYAANTRAVLPWKHNLVTGGWKLPSGKRALVLVEPDGGDASTDHVTLRTRILEIPEEIFEQIGMGGLRTEGRESSAQMILADAQAKELLRSLEGATGVNVLSAPTISTSNGRQAQVQVGETKTAASGEQYQTGPLIDIVPRISPDRASVDLQISARLRYAAGTQ